MHDKERGEHLGVKVDICQGDLLSVEPKGNRHDHITRFFYYEDVYMYTYAYIHLRSSTHDGESKDCI